MKTLSFYLVCGVVIIFALVASGCVAPPQANNSAIPGNGNNPGQGSLATTTPTIQSYVTEVTAFVTPSTGAPSTGQGYSNFATTTPLPEDQSCLIYFNKQYYFGNMTAVSFNLKNPPMYINYSVIPFNITVHKVIDSRSGGDRTETLEYSDYAPYSWFEVTVRNKTTGTVYLQDGFGPAKGYSVYTNATFTILKRDDMLIEMKGNNITASTGVWVKPLGNFDNPGSQNFTECKNIGHPQNALPYQTQQTTTTWTPENVVTRALTRTTTSP
jgi:hypothetical protein